jgi:hypothetical protein
MIRLDFDMDKLIQNYVKLEQTNYLRNGQVIIEKQCQISTEGFR